MTVKPGPRFDLQKRKQVLNDLKSMLAEGVEIKEAAYACNISVNYAYRVAKRYKWPYNYVSKAKRKRVTDAMTYGFTPEEVTSLYKISQGHIEKIIYDHSGHSGKKTPLIPETFSTLE